ncbi:MAG: PKD domain-containing protein, partial [Bacteroidales bacterium]|nr:PKD domain-containing protein [Bacteroidales bacterium]
MKFVLPLFFLLQVSFAYSQCLKSIDFSSWRQQGNLTQGSWIISNNNRTITQTENLKTTFYVGQNEYINTNITGTIRVNDTDDDDYVGFVFGYNNPISTTDNHDYWLFAWKKGTQQDYVDGQYILINGGYSLIRVEGSFPENEIDKAIWTHTQDSRFTIVDKKWGNQYGWESYKEHTFQLKLTPSRVQIYIDGEVIFDVRDCFRSGKFGFFNYSQEAVEYSNFNYTVLSDFSAQNTCVNHDFSSIIDNPLCGESSNFASYEWNFGDGTVSTQKLPTHVYSKAGEYTVTLVVADAEGC